jgi:hypothetical protein
MQTPESLNAVLWSGKMLTLADGAMNETTAHPQSAASFLIATGLSRMS